EAGPEEDAAGGERRGDEDKDNDDCLFQRFTSSSLAGDVPSTGVMEKESAGRAAQATESRSTWSKPSNNRSGGILTWKSNAAVRNRLARVPPRTSRAMCASTRYSRRRI